MRVEGGCLFLNELKDLCPFNSRPPLCDEVCTKGLPSINTSTQYFVGGIERSEIQKLSICAVSR